MGEKIRATVTGDGVAEEHIERRDAVVDAVKASRWWHEDPTIRISTRGLEYATTPERVEDWIEELRYLAWKDGIKFSIDAKREGTALSVNGRTAAEHIMRLDSLGGAVSALLHVKPVEVWLDRYTKKGARYGWVKAFEDEGMIEVERAPVGGKMRKRILRVSLNYNHPKVRSILGLDMEAAA